MLVRVSACSPVTAEALLLAESLSTKSPTDSFSEINSGPRLDWKLKFGIIPYSATKHHHTMCGFMAAPTEKLPSTPLILRTFYLIQMFCHS